MNGQLCCLVCLLSAEQMCIVGFYRFFADVNNMRGEKTNQNRTNAAKQEAETGCNAPLS